MISDDWRIENYDGLYSNIKAEGEGTDEYSPVEVAKVFFGDGVRRYRNIPYRNETEKDEIQKKL